MRSSKRVVKAALGGALVLAIGAAALFQSERPYAANDVKLSTTSRNILTRQSYDFDVIGASSDAVVKWKSSNEKVATVDQNGVVTGIKKGEVTITCEVTSAGTTQKATAKVSICKPAVKIEINNKITELKYGKTFDLNRTLVPKTSNDVTTWKSSDPSIATVDSNGVVKALKDGVVTITASTMSGKTDSTIISVYGAPQPTKAPDATATPVPTKAPQATKAPTPTPTKKPSSAKNLEYTVSDLTPNGYGYSIVPAGSGVKVTYEGQYQEVYYELPKKVDLSKYDKLIITAQTSGESDNDLVAFKIVPSGAELDEWNNPVPIVTEYNFASKKKTDYEISLSEFVKKDVTRIGIMAQNGSCSVTLYKFTFVLKDGAKADTEETKKPANVTYNFASMQDNGYGYSAKAGKDSVQVSFDSQYQEIYYTLPSAVDLKNYSKILVKLSTASDAADKGVAIKLVATDAELDEWNNPTPCHVQWGFVSKSVTEYEIDAAELTGKKINRISFMANDAACDATIYSITFVPKN